jgi:hypothetical protein
MKYASKKYRLFRDLNFFLNYSDHFRLYLALCNDDSFVKESHNIILNEYNKSVQWLSFLSDNRFLFSFLENNIDSSKITIVNGLKDNHDIETVFATMNVIRESFYKLKLPIILWVDESIMAKFIRIAPDFYSCTGTIHLL